MDPIALAKPVQHLRVFVQKMIDQLQTFVVVALRRPLKSCLLIETILRVQPPSGATTKRNGHYASVD